MTQDIQARPDMIGGVPTPPLAILPKPERLFSRRAERFAFLAEGSNLGPYLTFLAGLTRIQAQLAASLPPVAAPQPDRIALARSSRMPPLDRHALVDDPALGETLDALHEGAAVAGGSLLHLAERLGLAGDVNRLVKHGQGRVATARAFRGQGGRA